MNLDTITNTRASRALGILGVLLLVVLVVPFVVYSVPAVAGGDASYVVLTASMTPAIAPGDVVIVESVDAADVAVGDVITFRRSASDEVPVTHRVIEVVASDEGVAFRTQGDANEDPDAALVTPDRMVGRVSMTIPLIGYVVEFVNSPMGFVTLVVVPIGLLILSEAYDFVRANRANRATREQAGDASSDADSTTDADSVAASSASSPDGNDVGAEQPVGTEPPAAATGGASDEGVEISLTTADLTLSSVLVAAFAVYGGYVAMTLRDSLSIAVAVAVASVALITLAMRLSVDGDAPAAPAVAATDGGHAAVVPGATLSDAHHDVPRVTLDSVADLTAVAGRVGRPVVRDADGVHYLLYGDVAYTATVQASGRETVVGADHADAAHADADAGDADVPAGDDEEVTSE